MNLPKLQALITENLYCQSYVSYGYGKCLTVNYFDNSITISTKHLCMWLWRLCILVDWSDDRNRLIDFSWWNNE